jgi:hypothetical protein
MKIVDKMGTNIFKFKVSLIILSIIIFLYSILLLKFDKWILDLYYFLHLFSLFIAIDFTFYIINCSHSKGKSHYAFCSFPLTRFDILFLELKNYFSRWEFKVFILSILVFISTFFLLNSKNIFGLLILLIVYLIQITYLVTLFFIIKNFIKQEKLKSDLKNLVSMYISITIFIVVLSDKSQLFQTILLVNPLSNGFIAYLMGINYGLLGSFLSICLAFIIIAIAKNKFKVWDLY